MQPSWKFPAGRTHWGIDRKEGDTWIPQTFVNPNGGKRLRWLKPAALTEEKLREHLGVGHFRLHWYKRGSAVLPGPEFDILPSTPINTAPPSPATASTPLAGIPVEPAPRSSASDILSPLPQGSAMNEALASLLAVRQILSADEDRIEQRRAREHEREMLMRTQEHAAQMAMIREQGETQRETMRQLHTQQMEAQRIALTPKEPEGPSAEELEELIDERLDELYGDDDGDDDGDGPPDIRNTKDALRYFLKMALTEPDKAREALKLIPDGLRMMQELAPKKPIVPPHRTGNGSEGGAAPS